MFKNTISGIKTVFQDNNSWTIAIAAGAILSYLYYWLLSQVTTIPAFFTMAQNGEFGENSILYAFFYWATTIATIIFFGISAATLAWLWRHSKMQRLIVGGTNAFGVFAGALGSSCPVCGAFLLNAVGITSGVATMPFQGLEFKFASLGLMVGSTVFASRKVKDAVDCEECDDISKHKASDTDTSRKRVIILPLEKVFVSLLIGLFVLNQILISQVAAVSGLPTGGVARLFGIKTASAAVIIAPKLNPDGKTTSLVEQPTISEVLANPNSGDALADAKVVMMATGKPFYAPEDISFDDPINAQKKWGAFENSIKLSGDLETRYQKLISTMVCSYCCGGPTSVTTINRCGCAHAKAVRGMFKYMLQTYGSEYSDDQLLGEAHRWYAIWYPKGMLEDYLLATGNSVALPHKTHGGAGTDGMHGLAGN